MTDEANLSSEKSVTVGTWNAGRQSSHDLSSSGISVGFQSLASFRRQLLRSSQGIASWNDPRERSSAVSSQVE